MYKICAFLVAAMMLVQPVYADNISVSSSGETIEVTAEQVSDEHSSQTENTDAQKLERLAKAQDDLRKIQGTSIAPMYDEYMEVLMDLVDIKSPEEILMLKDEVLKENVHPRLFARREKFEEIKKSIAEDSFLTTIYNKMTEYAEQITAQPPIKRSDPEIGTELAFARECVDRALLLGMLYRLDNNEKYKDFLYAQMELAILDYMQWDTIKVLESAEMTFGISLAYDWLYDGLDNSQREYLKDIIKKRLQMVEDDYSGNFVSFPVSLNNWNAVCNGSYGSAAVSILYEEPAFASQMLHNASKHITISMSEMLPSGGFSEGPGYWVYQVQYISYFLSCLTGTFGNDLGLGEMPAFCDTALYPVYMHGPTYAAFNFADAGEGLPVTVYNYWFAQKYGFDGLQKIAQDVNPAGTNYDTWEMKGTDSLILLWYTKMKNDIFETLPTGKVFGGGKVPAASLRSEWDNPLATYVAFKGGHGQASHGNLDLGTFVIDALGKRWVSDLGGEDYGMEGYWDFSEKGGRWQYYTQRAEGHNLFVINPAREPDQAVYEKADITEFDEVKGYGIVDLSPIYQKNATSARRGIALCGDSVVVRDEISTRKSDDTTIWGINTKASIEVAPSGKYADLTLNDEKMRVYIVGDNDYQFEIAKPESMVYARKEGEKTFPNFQRLVIKTYKGGNIDFSIQFSPYSKGEHPPQAFQSIKKLDEWKTDGDIYTYDGYVDEVLFDNEPLSLFSANKMGYTVYLKDGKIPDVTVKYDSINVSVSKTDAQKIGDSTIIEVTSKDPRMNNLRYSFRFENKFVFGEPIDKKEYIPDKIDFTNIGNVENPHVNIIDGRLDTRWAAEGENEIIFNFNEPVELDMVTVAFFYGNQRRAIFDLAVSEDGENFKTVFSGMSSGLSNNPEQFAIERQKVKVVKYIGHGNSTSMWNNVTEVGFWG